MVTLYRRQQGQVLRHRCMWPDCAVLVPLAMWGCARHWSLLPATLRKRIGRAYRDGVNNDTHPTRAYVDAHRAALEWVAWWRDHGPGAIGFDNDPRA